MSRIGVKAEYKFKGEIVHTVESYPDKPSEELFRVNRDGPNHAFSGKHDNGQLPPMKNEGPYALLAASIVNAKQKSEEFLVDKVEKA